jgi:hypothetical protein
MSSLSLVSAIGGGSWISPMRSHTNRLAHWVMLSRVCTDDYKRPSIGRIWSVAQMSMVLNADLKGKCQCLRHVHVSEEHAMNQSGMSAKPSLAAAVRSMPSKAATVRPSGMASAAAFALAS